MYVKYRSAYQDVIDATFDHHYIAWVHLIVTKEPAQTRLSVAVTLVGKCHEGKFEVQRWRTPERRQLCPLAGKQGAHDVTASLKVGSVTLRAPLLLDRRLLG